MSPPMPVPPEDLEHVLRAVRQLGDDAKAARLQSARTVAKSLNEMSARLADALAASLRAIEAAEIAGLTGFGADVSDVMRAGTEALLVWHQIEPMIAGVLEMLDESAR